MSGPDTGFIKVMIRRATGKALLVSLGGFEYGSLYLAKQADQSAAIPRSQIVQVVDLGDGRQAIEVPQWLIRSNHWGAHQIYPQTPVNQS